MLSFASIRFDVSGLMLCNVIIVLCFVIQLALFLHLDLQMIIKLLFSKLTPGQIRLLFLIKMGFWLYQKIRNIHDRKLELMC